MTVLLNVLDEYHSLPVIFFFFFLLFHIFGKHSEILHQNYGMNLRVFVRIQFSNFCYMLLLYFLKFPPVYIEFRSFWCRAYWRAVLKRGRFLFKVKRASHIKTRMVQLLITTLCTLYTFLHLMQVIHLIFIECETIKQKSCTF